MAVNGGGENNIIMVTRQQQQQWEYGVCVGILFVEFRRYQFVDYEWLMKNSIPLQGRSPASCHPCQFPPPLPHSLTKRPPKTAFVIKHKKLSFFFS